MDELYLETPSTTRDPAARPPTERDTRMAADVGAFLAIQGARGAGLSARCTPAGRPWLAHHDEPTLTE
jgi:hypothetical protein